MSKILVLFSKTGKKSALFSTLISKHLSEKTTLVVKDYSDVVATVSKNTSSMTIGGEDVRNFDLVVIRISGKKIELAGTVASILQKTGVKFLDTGYANMGIRGTKFSALADLSHNGIPLPKTIYLGNNTYTQADFRSLSKELTLPFIAKDTAHQRGIGVHLIRSAEDLLQLSSEDEEAGQYMFQELIHKEKEYRLLVLGDTVGVWEEKINNNEDEFRNNVSLGAEEIFLPIGDVPSEMSSLSIKAAQTRDLQIAGVDVMIEKDTGKIYLIEVNRGPGLTYDENVSPEFKALASFLEREARDK